MKKLYLNIVWPGILILLLHPFSGKIASLHEVSGSPASRFSATETSSGLLTETSESVCGELLFEPDNRQGVLQLPAFDPTKGQLVGVQITTEGTLIADIRRSNLSHNDYHALFSADLKCTFPGDLKLSHTSRLNYQASLSQDRQKQNGIEVLVDETTTATREVTQSLERYYGTGNLSIPLEAVNLINLKAENFKYRTQLRAKVCIDYFYQTK